MRGGGDDEALAEAIVDDETILSKPSTSAAAAPAPDPSASAPDDVAKAARRAARAQKRRERVSLRGQVSRFPSPFVFFSFSLSPLSLSFFFENSTSLAFLLTPGTTPPRRAHGGPTYFRGVYAAQAEQRCNWSRRAAAGAFFFFFLVQGSGSGGRGRGGSRGGKGEGEEQEGESSSRRNRRRGGISISISISSPLSCCFRTGGSRAPPRRSRPARRGARSTADRNRNRNRNRNRQRRPRRRRLGDGLAAPAAAGARRRGPREALARAGRRAEGGRGPAGARGRDAVSERGGGGGGARGGGGRGRGGLGREGGLCSRRCRSECCCCCCCCCGRGGSRFSFSVLFLALLLDGGEPRPRSSRCRRQEGSANNRGGFFSAAVKGERGALDEVKKEKNVKTKRK